MRGISNSKLLATTLQSSQNIGSAIEGRGKTPMSRKTSILSFAGKCYEVDYGPQVSALNIYNKESMRMRYKSLVGPSKGATGVVTYDALDLGNGRYLISWQEVDGGTVVHLDDFRAGISHVFYTTATGDFFRARGTLKECDVPSADSATEKQQDSH
jgi:hypothetical protein